MTEPRPIPYALWAQAMREHDYDPSDFESNGGRDPAVQKRYRELMIEYGHLRRREP